MKEEKYIYEISLIAGCEYLNICNYSARAAPFLGFCMVIGMGMRFSKTWFTEVHLPPGGRTAQSKMAAILWYGMQPVGDKIVRSWHEIGQIICNLGPGIQICHFQKCHIDGFCVKSNMAAKFNENGSKTGTIWNYVYSCGALYEIHFDCFDSL